MNIRSHIVLFVLMNFSAGAAYSQERIITEAEYNHAYQAARDVTNGVFPRRERTTETAIDNGEVTPLFIATAEYESSDRMRFIDARTTNSAGDAEMTEVIAIGNVFYCRARNGKTGWKRSKGYCGKIMTTGTTDAEPTSFRLEEVVEDGKKIMLYSQYGEHRWLGGTVSFTYSRFWVNPDGTLLRQDKKAGKDYPKGTKWEQVTKYEYRVAIDPIEAPIK